MRVMYGVKLIFISIIISHECSDSLIGRFSDVTGKCFTGAYSIDKIFKALFPHFYFSATWSSSNKFIELGIHCTNVKFGTLHLRQFFSKTVCGILEFRFSFQIIGSNVKSMGQKFIIKLQIAFILF